MGKWTYQLSKISTYHYERICRETESFSNCLAPAGEERRESEKEEKRCISYHS